MRAVGSRVALVAAGLSACVQVHRRVVVADTVVASTEVVGGEVDVTWTGSVRAGEQAFEIRVMGERRCGRVSEQQVTRRTTIERSPDGLMLGTSIVAGLAFAGLGAVFLLDHRDGADVEEPLLYRGDKNVGRGTGIALLATGALGLSSAAIAGLRARDEVRPDVKADTRRVPLEGTLACGTARASGVQITFGDAALAVPAGSTDDGGHLVFPFSLLPDALIADRDRATLRITGATRDRTFVVGEVPLTQARKVRLAAAWSDAEAGGAPERFEDYARLDPARANDAMARARALRTARIAKHLDARDVSAAEKELQLLRQHHAHGVDIDGLAIRINRMEGDLHAMDRQQRLVDATAKLAAAVAAVQERGAGPEAFEAARAQLDEVRRAYGEVPRMSDLVAAFEAARETRVKELLAESQRHVRASELELARRAARDAALVAPGDPRVDRAVRVVDDRELGAIEREARKALRAGRNDDAIRTIDRGVAIRSDDPRMARLMEEVRTSSKRARERERLDQQRAREAAIRAELTSVRAATRRGDYAAARRAVEQARHAHGDDPQWTAASARVDKAELDAELGRATKALARQRVDEAAAHVDRAFALGPDDPRVARLVMKIRALGRSRQTTPAKEQRP